MRRSQSNRKLQSNMKLTHQRTSRYDNAPESLTDWLEEQLDSRGIDAVVYTRYILSLLLEDSSDSDDDIGGGGGLSSVSASDINRCSCKQTCAKDNIRPVTSTKWKHKRYLKQIQSNNGVNNSCVNAGTDWLSHSEYCLHSCPMNGDEERRLAVVECLKSASEQESGIESFVDELCAKLKTIKSLSETSEMVADSKADINCNNGVKKAVTRQEMAIKYYAAFPSLDTNSVDDTNANTVSKADTIEPTVQKKSVKNKIQWNGQKIIEFMSKGSLDGVFDGNRLLQGLMADTNGNTSQPTLITANDLPATDSKLNPKAFEIDKKNVTIVMNDGNKPTIEEIKAKAFYCRDIESKVLNKSVENETFLVVDKSPNVNSVKGFVDRNCEETDKFQRLVDKFNSNIASIWAKTGGNALSFNNSHKNDNIWSFDSSFSSNQSSATPSPKPNAIDIWSSMPLAEINERLANKTALTTTVDDMYSMPEMNWESNLLKSINAFPDDGFIDGNHDLIDDETNWLPNTNDSTLITLQNHQKNSPFIEFNLTPKTSEKDSALELSKLLSMVSLLSNKSKHHLSPPPEENLLTSPKTHFQPIKHDSFERDDSDEGSVADITDTEVKKLVICSDKCPNNGDHKPKESAASLVLRCRPVSTSLDEMASYMGPFSDFEFGSNEFLTSLPISEEMEFTIGHKESQMSDKSTNTENDLQMDVKAKLEPILESNVEGEPEPEYQDLYNMINEVLRNGILDNDNSLVANSSATVTSLDDWYDSDYDNCNDLVSTPSREKRLSWNCYWDTYDIASTGDHSMASKSHFKPKDPKPRLSGEDISGDQMTNSFAFGSKFSKKLLTETNDDVFADELYSTNSRFANCSLSECPEYEEVLDDYGFPRDDFDAYLSVNGDNGSDYHSKKDMSTFGDTFNLQLKPRYSEGPKRSRKPCTFFIEGQCKRSDCKYSHDMSAITCKYWEEGFCFKAEMCPFLHSYTDEPQVIKTKPFGWKSRKCYAIESESDFPSLAILPDSGENTPTPSEADQCPPRVEHHFFDFRTTSVADNGRGNCGVGLSKAKLPITVVMKKKVKKRKDRNLQ